MVSRLTVVLFPVSWLHLQMAQAMEAPTNRPQLTRHFRQLVQEDILAEHFFPQLAGYLPQVASRHLHLKMQQRQVNNLKPN